MDPITFGLLCVLLGGIISYLITYLMGKKQDSQLQSMAQSFNDLGQNFESVRELMVEAIGEVDEDKFGVKARIFKGFIASEKRNKEIFDSIPEKTKVYIDSEILKPVAINHGERCVKCGYPLDGPRFGPMTCDGCGLVNFTYTD